MDQLIITGFLQYDLCDSCNCFIFKGLIFMFCWELMIHHLTFLAFSSSSFLSSQYHPAMKEKQIKHDKYCFLVPFFVLRMKMQKKRIPNKQYNLPSSNIMAHFLLWMLINKTTTLHNSAKIMFTWFYSIVPEAMQIIYLCYYIALKQSMSEEFLQHYLP